MFARPSRRSSSTRAWLGLLAAAALAACGGAHRTKYPLCAGDHDCHAGERCVNQHCAQCAYDSDCPPGQECQAGACTPARAACKDDSACPAGTSCIDGACKPCGADGDCGPGGRCNAGRCTRAQACKTDDDCPPDKDCVNGLCLGDRRSSGPPPAGACQLASVYFAFDAAAVEPDQSAAVQADGQCVKSIDHAVVLEGHTDPSGTEEYNLGLSDRRARAVMSLLGAMGVDFGKMRVVPLGESGTADGDDDAARARERRVDVKWE